MSKTNNSSECGEGNRQADRNYREGVRRTVNNTTHQQRAEQARNITDEQKRRDRKAEAEASKPARD